MKIMNVVWPITGLYLPIIGWLLYADMARQKPMSMSGDMRAAHTRTDSLRNWLVRVDGLHLFSVRTAVRANVAYLLVHDADWHGSRLHRQLPGQLVSSSRGRETGHVRPTSFLQSRDARKRDF
jgi:hypothetical protein